MIVYLSVNFLRNRVFKLDDLLLLQSIKYQFICRFFHEANVCAILYPYCRSILYKYLVYFKKFISVCKYGRRIRKFGRQRLHLHMITAKTHTFGLTKFGAFCLRSFDI